jgi:TonB family protein
VTSGRLATGLLLAVVLAGCAGRGGGPYADLGPARQAVEGLQGRTCAYVSDPVVPSTLDDVARPGTRGTILLWARGDGTPDTLEVSVRYGEDGRLSWVQAINGTGANDRRRELERLLTGGLSDEGPPDWGLRVRVVAGQVEAVLPSVICEPERIVTGSRVAPPVGSAAEVAEAWAARGRQLEVAVSLDEAGRVLNVALLRGSGSRLLDQYAIDLARSYRYAPRLHDGIGVPSVHRYRLQIPRRF